MIDAGYVRLMARYNIWQNENLLTAAEKLDDAGRKADRRGFFGSIAGTLSHVLWADLLWMGRIDGGAQPECGIPGSATLFPDWAGYRDERRNTDQRILLWADNATDARITRDVTFHSMMLGTNVVRPLPVILLHLFNHQTHHRGQVHAMLTAAGIRPNDTDLFVMPDGIGD